MGMEDRPIVVGSNGGVINVTIPVNFKKGAEGLFSFPVDMEKAGKFTIRITTTEGVEMTLPLGDSWMITVA